MSVLERHIVSSELSCGIGILHKMVDFSVVVGCDVSVMWSEKCLFEGEFLGICDGVVQSA